MLNMIGVLCDNTFVPIAQLWCHVWCDAACCLSACVWYEGAGIAVCVLTLLALTMLVL